ncbi:hypothetical protein F7230_07535 [Corynebacterium sp. 320]|uniref:hypothetical protein n=1 Tax=Corynebacterium TaxID=1716 RepID=UPI00125CBAA0|nr:MULTISPECIES: hypothetical protein [Corynebacterium]KAB1502842.1 hypothetical protein F7230_07535 [Corynebacterium sp. 320]KAB1552353.1 hypothetical protein F7233_00855 [Corynebacterium sp. 321]KAB1554432.1 hypothetical protein F7232_05740 [Corynebacterium sp. 319]KAB3526505.1 hypothetical protein F8354_07535 [Corynebacterium sp. 250]KAB3539825.1 hypothetical protein F8390_00590 [Corynebacterium sp. 366]
MDNTAIGRSIARANLLQEGKARMPLGQHFLYGKNVAPEWCEWRAWNLLVVLLTAVMLLSRVASVPARAALLSQ